ncbi:lipopolysaccharide biosynthesis protein [Halorarius litoreus]|uniref:lipopolysaccharide biosynthesis protein n=1 Tax=Halorarius litoreus TaxID=2962676 RepID=UPI0020CFA36F|nr:polysaccharide biosynthesis C-terminal domain-containing protein [Halorarius litoreus]
MKRNPVTAFLSIAGGRIGVILVSFLTTPALVHFLTKAEYGAYGVVMAVFGLLMILVSSGINSGVRKYLAEDRDRADWASSVFGFYFRVAFVLAVIPAVLFAVAAHTGFISKLGLGFGPAFRPYFYLLAVLTLAAQFREYIRRALMGLELEHVSEPIKVLHKVTFGIVAVGLAALGFGVEGVLAGEIVASSLAFIVAFYFISREVSLRQLVQPLPDDLPKRELFGFNSLTVVYIFLLTSMYHVDILMVNDMVNSQTAGVYKGALVIVQFLWLVPRSVQSVLIQETSSLWNEGRVEKVTEMASKATRYTLLFTLLLAVGLGALAFDFVPLYLGSDYAAAALPVVLLLPGTLGFAVARPIFSISHAKGELKTVIGATGASAVLNLVLNALLIPRYGMVGAAVATSIGYGSLPFFHYWGARRIGYDPFADARLGRIALTGVLTTVPIVGLTLTLSNRWLALLVVPPVGFLLYAVLALATGAIDVEEVRSVLVSVPVVGPRVRRFDSPLAGERRSRLSFNIERTQRLLNRLLLVGGILLFAAGIVVAVGVDDPTPDISSTNITSTATPTPADTGEATPTASPTTASPTGSPTATASSTPGTATPNGTATGTATGTPTGTATAAPTASPSPTGESTPRPTDPPDTPEPTATPSPTPTASPTPTESQTPTASATPTATATETATPSSTPTATATATATPTSTPTSTPTATATGTSSPSAMLGGLWSLVRTLVPWTGGVAALVLAGRRG